MRNKRSVAMLVIAMSIAGAFLAGATAKAPADHHIANRHASIHDVAIDSVITPGATPDVYYDF